LPAPEKGKSEQDFPFSGAAPLARMDPLRSNAKEDSRPRFHFVKGISLSLTNCLPISK